MHTQRQVSLAKFSQLFQNPMRPTWRRGSPPKAAEFCGFFGGPAAVIRSGIQSRAGLWRTITDAAAGCASALATGALGGLSGSEPPRLTVSGSGAVDGIRLSGDWLDVPYRLAIAFVGLLQVIEGLHIDPVHRRVAEQGG